MTEDDALRCVGLLAGAIPGFGEAAVEVFAASFEKLEDPVALEEICRRVGETWVPAPNGPLTPSLGELMAEYRDHPARRAARADRARAAGAGRTAEHCDGTGWIRLADGPAPEGDYAPIEDYRPCRRCNPYLAEVYDDSPKWHRYMAGATLDELHPKVRRLKEQGQRNGTMGLVDGETMPPRCQVETFHEHYPSYEEGKAIAYASMMAALTARGATDEQIRKAQARLGEVTERRDPHERRTGDTPVEQPSPSTLVRSALKETEQRVQRIDEEF